jgi:hypothetical protein
VGGGIYFLPFLIIVVLGVCCDIYKSSGKISQLNLPPPSFSFVPPPPIPGIVSTCHIFPISNMCTQYLHHIHPLIPFPHMLPLPTGPSPQTGPGKKIIPFFYLSRALEFTKIIYIVLFYL